MLSNSLILSGIVTDIAINNNLAYVATSQNLHVLNISDPPNLIEVTEQPFAADQLIIDGNYLYLTNEKTLSIVDITDFALVGSYSYAVANSFGQGEIYEMAKSGSVMYLAVRELSTSDSSLRLLNVSNPANPTPIGFSDIDARSLMVVNNTVYLTNRAGTFYMIDASTPSNLSIIGQVAFSGSFTREVQIHNALAYLISPDEGLTILNVADPSNLFQEGSFQTSGQASDFFIKDDTAYLADTGFGVVAVDFSTLSIPVELGWYGNLGYAFDVMVKDSYLYALSGELTDYNDTGLRVVDISVPGAPVQTGIANDVTGSYDVAIEGNLAYLAAGSSGLQIVDVSDPMIPAKVGGVDITNGRAENIDVNGTYAFIAAEYGDLRIIDVSNPASPQEVVQFDEQVRVNDVIVVGNYAYLATEYATDSGNYENPLPQGMRILDVSDPLNPVPEALHEIPQNLSQGMYGGARRLAIAGDCAYVARISGGIDLVNIQNPLSPTKMGTVFATPSQIEIVGNRLYAVVRVLNYENNDYEENQFLYVLDISTPCAPLILGAYWLPYETYNVAATENSIFVASGDAGIFEIEQIDFQYMNLPIMMFSK